MALTLVSILTLAAVVAASPLPQITDPTAPGGCISYYQSQSGDTCRSIGYPWGFYDTDILAANPFLNCEDIWTGTWICIPNVPRPVTVTYPPTPTAFVTTLSTTPAPLPTPVCIQTYTSVAGDTCNSIGTKFGITGSDIYNSNTFLNCNDIWAYTPICIPAIFNPPTPTCSLTYTSVAGDTCDSIGQKYGISATDVYNSNSFLNCNDIWVNTPICIARIVIDPPACMYNYISQAGDTCDSLGTKYHISGAQILSANSFLNCSDIWVGTPICVPWSIISDPFPTDGSTTTTVLPTISDPFPTDGPVADEPITWDPPTDPVTSDPPTDPVTTDTAVETETV